VFRQRLPAKYPRRARPVQYTESSSPEFRTRFHRKHKSECWSLAASEFALGHPEKAKTPLQGSQRKTGIYNMLEQKGQSDVRGGPWGAATELAGGEEESVEPPLDRPFAFAHGRQPRAAGAPFASHSLESFPSVQVCATFGERLGKPCTAPCSRL
jgi:hypothetical protein